MNMFSIAVIALLTLQANLVVSFNIPGAKKKLSEECGYVNDVSGFIIGGEETVPNRYPWLAMQRPSGGNQIGCTAALISDQWVLTAAHCDYGDSNLFVALGGHDMTNPDEPNKILVKVEKQYNHENYSWPDTYPWNDFALMKLAEKVEFNDYIRPVCLPTRTEAQEEYWNVDVKAIGWGQADNTDDWVAGLREVDTKTITKEQQEGGYDWCVREQFPFSICIQTDGGSVGICFGDSGGPLLYRRSNGQYITIGVTSFFADGGGPGCQTGLPHGYNSVPYHLDWIQEITGIEIEP